VGPLELLPVLTPERLAAAPEPLLRALFERFQLQVRYHCEGHGAWVFQAEDALGKASGAGLTLAPLAVCALRLFVDRVPGRLLGASGLPA
jgi:hypothetical protein